MLLLAGIQFLTKVFFFFAMSKFSRVRFRLFVIIIILNTIRDSYINPKTDNVQQNNKCRLRGDRNQTIYFIRSDCCKRVQKKYEKVGRVVTL